MDSDSRAISDFGRQAVLSRENDRQALMQLILLAELDRLPAIAVTAGVSRDLALGSLLTCHLDFQN